MTTHPFTQKIKLAYKLALILLLSSAFKQCTACQKKGVVHADLHFTLEASIPEGKAYLEDGKTEIDLTIHATDEVAQRIGYKLTDWYVAKGRGQLLTKSGVTLETGHELAYGSQHLYYQPAQDSQGEHMLVISIQADSSKLRKKLTLPISVHHHRIVQFQVKAQAHQSSLLLHQLAELNILINAKDKEAQNLGYHITAMSLEPSGRLSTTPQGAAIHLGEELRYGNNQLYYHAQGHAGEHRLALRISNEKGDEQSLSTWFLFSDAGFSAQASLEELAGGNTSEWVILLDLGAVHPTKEDEWQLCSWHLSQGLRGRLEDGQGCAVRASGMKLKSGVRQLPIKVSTLGRLNEAPELTLILRQPDGTMQELVVQLSALLAKQLIEQAHQVSHQVSAIAHRADIDRAYQQQKLDRQLSILQANVSLLSVNRELPSDQIAELQEELSQVKQATSRALSPPDYRLTASLVDSVAYIEEGKSQLTVLIESANALAQSLSYKLSSWQVEQGEGRLLGREGTLLEAGYSLSYGVNELFYAPSTGSAGSHTLKLLVECEQQVRQCQLSIAVRSHRPAPSAPHKIESSKSSKLSSSCINSPAFRSKHKLESVKLKRLYIDKIDSP